MILKNFIVMEGLDGSGTTTQLKNLLKLCQKNNVQVFGTQEPTQSPIGNLITSFLRGKIVFSDETVLRLFAVDRAEHIYGKGGIICALDAGSLVISDRYLFSSLAYQGNDKLKSLVEKQNEDFPLPEILFFLDVRPKTAMQRIKKRNEAKQKYEVLSFLENVRKNYLDTIEQFRQKEPCMKIFLLDGEGSEDDVFSLIKDKMKETGYILE